MISIPQVYKILKQLENVTEKEHFESLGYFANNRMFATVWKEKKEVNLRLRPSEQRRVLLIDGEGFAEIHNAWGKQGWTKVQLECVEEKDFETAVLSAYEHSQYPTKRVKKDKPRRKKKAR